MTIAVASGKGGTGKTTVAIALSESVERSVNLIDCDAEEPNVMIFMRPKTAQKSTFCIKVPEIDERKCVLCGKCAEVCQFNAIAVLKDRAMVFADLCHSCGGCELACPNDAIFEIDKVIGKITRSKTGEINVIESKIDVGHGLVPPIIREAKKFANNHMLNILDCPPGTGCPAVVAMSGSDYILLVTEATPFGLNDLMLSVDVSRKLGIPFSVIINRVNDIYFGVQNYCKYEDIRIMLEIPESHNIAKAYSRGESLFSAMPEMKEKMSFIIDEIIKVCV